MTGRKVVLVTGGGRGIGAAVVRLAAAAGWDVAFTYASNAARAAETESAARALGAEVLAIKADVADAAETEAAFAAVESRFGRLDGLVNNAGITGPRATLAETPDAVWESVLRTNVIGAARFSRLALRRLPQGGSIVMVSSRAAGLGGGGEWIHYAASKGAMDSMTIGLAKEAAAQGVRVNAVSPGLIDTELHAAAGFPDRVAKFASAVPLARGGTAEEVAEAVIWLLSDAARYVTGANIHAAQPVLQRGAAEARRRRALQGRREDQCRGVLCQRGLGAAVRRQAARPLRQPADHEAAGHGGALFPRHRDAGVTLSDQSARTARKEWRRE